MRPRALTPPARRFSRRNALRLGAAGLGAGALTLVGCGGGDSGSTDSDLFSGNETPQPGGRFTIGLNSDPAGLDPIMSTSNYWVAANIHGYLYMVDLRDQSLIPLIAERFEHVDDLTYIWTLRPGVRFQNLDPVFGREVTAEDVDYSMKRHRDDPAANSDKQLLRDFTASFGPTDRYTFKLVTSRPYAPTYDELGNPSYPIEPHEAVEKWGDLQTRAVGCGAMILREYVRAEKIVLDRNPDYWEPGRPHTDGRDWQIVLDESSLFQAFKTQRHDYNGALLDKLKVEELQKIPHVKVDDAANYWHRKILLRVDRPPFQDQRLCEAIDLAVDRQDLIDKVAFGEGQFAGPIVNDLSFWALPQDEVRQFYKVNIEKAKQLVSAAGYPNGLDIDVIVENVPDLPTCATVVKEHLAKIGINSNLILKEAGTYLAQHLFQGNFQMTWYIDLPYVEPDRPLGNWFSKGMAGFNFCGYSNPEIDDWIWKERSEFDPDKRQQIVLDAQRAIMRQHGPQICTFTPRAWAAYWDWVHSDTKDVLKMGAYGWLAADTWLSRKS